MKKFDKCVAIILSMIIIVSSCPAMVFASPFRNIDQEFVQISEDVDRDSRDEQESSDVVDNIYVEQAEEEIIEDIYNEKEAAILEETDDNITIAEDIPKNAELADEAVGNGIDVTDLFDGAYYVGYDNSKANMQFFKGDDGILRVRLIDGSYISFDFPVYFASNATLYNFSTLMDNNVISNYGYSSYYAFSFSGRSTSITEPISVEIIDQVGAKISNTRFVLVSAPNAGIEPCDYTKVYFEEGHYNSVLSESMSITAVFTGVTRPSSVSTNYGGSGSADVKLGTINIRPNESFFAYNIPLTVTPKEVGRITIHLEVDGVECSTIIDIIDSNQTKEYYIYRDNDEYEVFDRNVGDIVEELAPSTYDPQLAHMLACFSKAAYNNDQVRASLLSFGMENISLRSYTSSIDTEWYGDDNVAYSFSKKELKDGSTLVMIVIRGSYGSILRLKYGLLPYMDSDWRSDLFHWLSSTPVGGLHDGFRIAADKVYDALKVYLSSEEIENYKFVVTGHSRGASVGNLVEKQLIDDGYSNVYGYNFACPDVGRYLTSQWSAEKKTSYNSIFNINNTYDVITVIPGLFVNALQDKDTVLFRKGRMQWDKYGVSKWFSGVSTNADAAHNIENYINFLRQEKSISSYVSRKETRVEQQMSLLGQLLGGNAAAIYCPVDINIKDKNGNTIAAVINNEPVYYTAKIEDLLILINEDEKVIFAPGYDYIDIEMIATDTGEMTVCLSSSSLGNWDKIFENVAIKKGEHFESAVRYECSSEELELHVIQAGEVVAGINEDGSRYEVDHGKDIANCNISLSNTSYTYNGKAKKPTVTVEDGGITLVSGIDYVVEYFDNVNAGTATARVTGIGNYKNSRAIQFTINKVAPKLVFASANITKKITDEAFTNNLTMTTDGTVTFKSSDISVATVNKTSGKVDIKGTGTTTITVTSTEGMNYKAGTAKYILTVLESSDTEKKNQSMEAYPWTDELPLETYTLTTVKNAVGSITYSSDNPEVVDVDQQGWLYAGKKSGTAIITVRASGNEEYLPASVQFTMHVMNVYLINWRKFGDGGEWFLYSDNTLVVEGKGTVKLASGYGGSYIWSECEESVDTVIIKNGIEEIADYGISGGSSYDNMAKSPIKIVLEDSVKKVGNYAFYRSNRLEEISFGSGLESIGRYSFTFCPKLKKIIVADDNPYFCTINGALYSKDRSMLYKVPQAGGSEIRVQEGTVIIAADAIGNCTAMTSVTIPATVKDIYSEAFDGSDNLKDVYYSGSKHEWNNIRIGTDNTPLLNANVHFAAKSSLSDCIVTLDKTSYTYNGQQRKPSVAVTDGTVKLISGTDYTVSYTNNTNAGTATAIITGKGNYVGKCSKTFKINKAAARLSFAESNVSKNMTESEFTNRLTKKTDGTVTFVSNDMSIAAVDAESGLVTIKGTGTVTITATATAGKNYKAGSASYTLTVTGISIEKASVSGVSLSYGYSGRTYTPVSGVKVNGVTLIEGTDYTVKYENNQNPGTATITVTGKGKYSGTKTKTFEIVDCVSSVVSGKTYLLIPKNNSKTAVCAYAGKMVNNTKIYITDRGNSESQKFKAVKNSDGTWKFINSKCELALAVQQNSSELGAGLVLYDQTTKPAQNWKLSKKSDNSFAIINSVTGYSIAMSDKSAVKGTTLSMAETASVGLQRFYIVETSAVSAPFDGTKSIRAAKDKNFSVNIASASKAEGANVSLYTYTNSNARKFKIIYSGGGYYRLVNVNSGLCLTIKDNSNADGANIIQSKWKGYSSQRWKITKNSDGTVTITNMLGTVLHLLGNRTVNNTNIHARKAASTTAQKWYLQ